MYLWKNEELRSLWSQLCTAIGNLTDLAISDESSPKYLHEVLLEYTGLTRNTTPKTFGQYMKGISYMAHVIGGEPDSTSYYTPCGLSQIVNYLENPKPYSYNGSSFSMAGDEYYEFSSTTPCCGKSIVYNSFSSASTSKKANCPYCAEALYLSYSYDSLYMLTESNATFAYSSYSNAWSLENAEYASMYEWNDNCPACDKILYVSEYSTAKYDTTCPWCNTSIVFVGSPENGCGFGPGNTMSTCPECNSDYYDGEKCYITSCMYEDPTTPLYYCPWCNESGYEIAQSYCSSCMSWCNSCSAYKSEHDSSHTCSGDSSDDGWTCPLCYVSNMSSSTTCTNCGNWDRDWVKCSQCDSGRISNGTCIFCGYSPEGEEDSNDGNLYCDVCGMTYSDYCQCYSQCDICSEYYKNSEGHSCSSSGGGEFTTCPICGYGEYVEGNYCSECNYPDHSYNTCGCVSTSSDSFDSEGRETCGKCGSINY